MNKICVLFVLCGVIIPYSLSSCAPMTRPMKEPPSVETAVEKPLLLGDRHKAAEIACGSCHQEGPPAKVVTTNVCLGCHEDYSPSNKAGMTDYMDPHNSHITYSDCGECHNVHKPSQDQCSSCHYDLGFHIP
jgi:hypothetical protein